MSKFAERDRLVRRVVKAACEHVDALQYEDRQQGIIPRTQRLEEAVGRLRRHEAAMLEGDRFAPLEDSR